LGALEVVVGAALWVVLVRLSDVWWQRVPP